MQTRCSYRKMLTESLFIISALLITTTSSAALNGQCIENEQCGTMDTYCRNGTCTCNENFMVFFDSCVQLPVPQLSCSHKSECKTSLGSRTQCRERQCACRSFHHIYEGQCVKSRSLGDFCDSNSQCYCGQSCLGRVGCIQQTCQCTHGYKEENRRCVPHMYHPHNSRDSELIIETDLSGTSSGFCIDFSKCLLVVSTALSMSARIM